MPNNATTCTYCGETYVESSPERADAPGRLCPGCLEEQAAMTPTERLQEYMAGFSSAQNFWEPAEYRQAPHPTTPEWDRGYNAGVIAYKVAERLERERLDMGSEVQRADHMAALELRVATATLEMYRREELEEFFRGHPSWMWVKDLLWKYDVAMREAKAKQS